jgi:uncharacterized membrane protein YbhN (UPF0104 family)
VARPGEAETRVTDDTLGGVDKRKVVIALGAAAVLSAGASAAIGDAADYGRIAHAFGHARTWVLPFCLVGEAAAYVGYLVSYRAVAAAVGGLVLRYRDAVRVVVFGFGGAVIGAAAGSLGVDFVALRAAGAGTHEAVRRTLALNTLHAAALMAYATVGSVVLLVRGISGPALIMSACWVSAVPAAVLAAAYLTNRARARRLMRVPSEPARRREARLPRWAGVVADKARKGFADTIGGVVLVRQVILNPGRYFGGLVGYPLFWLGDFMLLWTALYAFGYTLEPARLVVAEATAWLLTLLPLPAGGSGAAEATMTYTLHAVGVPLSEALPAALVYRVVSFWLPLVPALVLLPQVKPLQHDLEQSERAERDPQAPPPPA